MALRDSAPLTLTLSRGSASAAPGELKFAPDYGFLRALRLRVDQYFQTTGLRQRDCPQMYVKTAIILGWLAASYALLLLAAGTWWLAIPLACSLGLAMAACGFNIQHDGGHQAYSERAWMNRLAARSLDLLGGSSYVWARKHNVIHHSYCNITGHDNDINLGYFGRVSPHQARLPFHRWQHVYLWVLYGCLPLKWQLYDDFRDVAAGHIDGHRMLRPRGWDLMNFLLGKFTFFALALVIPLLLYPPAVVLGCYLCASFVQGLTLSVVFQLAHCVEPAAFPMPQLETGRMHSPWAAHQVETTVNFAPASRVLTWLIGGLNFQIEHHLFPRLCHIHYPALSRIVRQTCREFGITYASHPTFRAGVASHYRWLRQMGQNDQTTPSTSIAPAARTFAPNG